MTTQLTTGREVANPMIQLEVISVVHQTSSQVNTVNISYIGGDEKEEFSCGAEWEEVQLQVRQDTEPTIQIANIKADTYIVGGTMKLVINHPKLFGMYKVGDVIPLVTKREPVK